MKTIWKHLPWVIAIGLYLAAGAAPFLAPYPPEQQFREFPLQPPPPIRFEDENGSWGWRPYFRALPSGRQVGVTAVQQMPWTAVEFFADGTSYQWLGTTWRTRLLGSRDPARPLLLLGSDRLGRDVLSRLIYGARFSLAIGLTAVLCSAVVGVAFGALSGYLAGWADTLVMRIADVVFSLPGLFLIMGVRALFPIALSPTRAFWIITLAYALLGWAVFARIIRGQVLSLKTHDYVVWAQACGASRWWVLTRHILPFTLNTVLVQSMVLIPAFILGEVTLSFLGMGVQPPSPSLGNMLSAASSLPVMLNAPWLLTPALVLLLAVLSFNLLADRIKGVEKSTRMW